MSLKEQLKNDVVVHMKAGNRVALTTVRNVLGEIETREKSGKTPVGLDDLQVTALLQKEAAKRRDTAATYTAAGHDDRAEAEIAEAEAIVDGVIAELGADGDVLTMRSMGTVMKSVTPKIGGRFDGKAVSEIVKARLA